MSEPIKIYFIRGSQGYLQYGSGGRVSFAEDVGDADCFSSAESAQATLGLISRFDNVSQIMDCTVICGEFVPKEGFKAIELVLNIARWKKLYNLLIKHCTVAELLLFTGAESPNSIADKPIYEHIRKLSKGFEYWRSAPGSYSRHNKEEAFKCFKMMSKYAMNEKFKQQRDAEKV